MQPPLTKMQIRKQSISNIFGLVRNKGSRAHQGWDLNARVGTPVYAVEDGTIEEIGSSKDYGKYLLMSFNHTGKTYYAFYAHLSEIFKKKNDFVGAGTILAKSGKTGNASNLKSDEDHLHFEFRTQRTVTSGLSGRIDPGELLGYKYYSCSIEPI